MRNDKRRRRARIIVVIIIAVAVVACYVLPLATMNAAAEEAPPITEGAEGEEEFGTDDPSVLPPEVTAPEEKKPPATLEILPYPSEMDVDDRFVFQCIISNAPDGTTAEWSSGNHAVLIVDPTGSAVAVAPGNAEVTVRAGELRSSRMVHVNDLKANKISLSVVGVEGKPSPMGRTVYNIEVGDVIKINHVITPRGANLESISWSLSNTEIAEMSNSGELIAIASGDVSVTVKAGELSDTVYFTIDESGVPVDTLVRYIILIVIAIVIVVVVALIISRAVNIRKEEERKKAIAAKRRKDEARLRAVEAQRKAAEEAELVAIAERNKQALEAESAAQHSTKVSGATVSAAGDANKANDDGEERPLTLDDIE